MTARSNRERYVAGLTLLIIVVCLWVGSSFLMNNIFADQEYSKPFAITYINTASFSLYLLRVLIKKKRRGDTQRVLDFNHALYDEASRTSQDSAENDSGEPANEPDVDRQSVESARVDRRSSDSRTFFLRSSARATQRQGSNARVRVDPQEVLIAAQNDAGKLSIREVAKLGLTFCMLWFAANWSNNTSLAYTTVASSTILASTSGIFTLILGALAGIERFSLAKLAGVCMSVVGVVLISMADNNHEDNVVPPKNPTLGDFLSLLGALFYGCYTVLLKLGIKSETRVDMPMFFGFVGLFNIVLLWPLFWVLDATGLEPFQLPWSQRLWLMVVVNALLGTFVSDYLWLLSVLMTSPVVVTLGLSLTIPIALAGDIIFKGITLGLGYWLGAFMVATSFVVVNMITLHEVEQPYSGSSRTDFSQLS